MSPRASRSVLPMLLLLLWHSVSTAASTGIKISSVPEGVEVRIAGVPAGATPLARILPPGKVEISFGGITATVDVPPGKTASILLKQDSSGSFAVADECAEAAAEPFIEYSGSSGGIFGSRFADKSKILEPGVIEAVAAAQDWLVSHQDQDGRWSPTAFFRNCRGVPCSGPGSSKDYDTGVTALALLAFLWDGNSITHGNRRVTALNALRHLLRCQDKRGIFGVIAPEGIWMYGHAIATVALLEASEMDASPTLRAAGGRGLDVLLSCRNPGLAWRYGYQPENNDTSVTTWAMTALVLGRRLGFKVPFEAIAGGLLWYDMVTDQDNFRTGYTSRGDSGAALAESIGKFESVETMSAEALMMMADAGRSGEHLAMRGASRLLLNCLPRIGDKRCLVNMYYWLFGTWALARLGADKDSPAFYREAWLTWRPAVLKSLLQLQRKPSNGCDPCSTGSWDHECAFGPAGGRVYATAVGTLALLAPASMPDLEKILPPERTIRILFAEAFAGNPPQGYPATWSERMAQAVTPPLGAGELIVRVILLKTGVDPSKANRATFKRCEFFIRMPGQKILVKHFYNLDQAEFARLKKAGMHKSADLGFLSGYAEKEEREYLYRMGVTRSSTVAQYKGKLDD